MPNVSVKELIEAGVHFGHRTSRWNPKMGPYIYGKRNLIHIIDLKQTVRGLLRARNFLYNMAAEGGQIVFVATKRQAKDVVKEIALSCDMPYVTERWLGGMLTNYTTVRSRLKRLEELEMMVATGQIEQYSKKMISSINRQIRKLRRNLDGVRNMTRLPDAVIIVDPRRELIALKEAFKLKIASVCILDTDCDPDLVDICVPANDDAMRSVRLLCSQLAEAVASGRQKYEQQVAAAKKKAEEKAAAEREAEQRRKEEIAKKKADAAAVKAAMQARETKTTKAKADTADAKAKPKTDVKAASPKPNKPKAEAAAEKPAKSPGKAAKAKAPKPKAPEAKPARKKAEESAVTPEPPSPKPAQADEPDATPPVVETAKAKVEEAETA